MNADPAALLLILNGAVILLIGLLDGIPYGKAIAKQDEEAIRAWRLAHQSLCMGGTTIIAIGAAVAVLPPAVSFGDVIGVMIESVIAWSFVISGYGFVIAMNLEPFVGRRGLSWSRSHLGNNLVFIGNTIGALGSLVGAVLLIVAALGQGPPA